MEKIIAGELSRHDLCGNEIASVDRREQIFDKDRLASADLAGNDNETFGVVKSVHQIGHRLPVNRAFEKETSIGGELERLCGKPVQVGVHRRLKTSCLAVKSTN